MSRISIEADSSVARFNVLGLDREYYAFFGRRSVKVEPSPGVLCASIRPPWDSAIWRAIESPKPAPPSVRAESAR
jgi:hypothetical protein